MLLAYNKDGSPLELTHLIELRDATPDVPEVSSRRSPLLEAI
jgi:hypothetical protein